MGHVEGFINFILVFVSLGNLCHFIHSMSPSDPTWGSDGEKRQQTALDILAREVNYHQDWNSIEGSGTSLETTQHMIRTSTLKELGTQSADWHTTKSSVLGKHGLAPFSVRSRKANFKESPVTVGDYSDGDRPRNPVNIIIVTSKTTPNPGPTETCLLGVSACLSFNSLNGTSLVWNDMKRTLSFVWELHVFGSASLFLLQALLGIVGVIRAHTLAFPLRDAVTLTNSLVVISATLRAVLFLLDPYGTCQRLSRASFTALYNIPLHLLLWAQTSLALLTLRGFRLLFFQLNVQHLWVVGVLALTHCIPLVVADLYPSVISHALPLLLQTLSLCWGVPMGIGIIMKSLSNVHFSRSSLPQWLPSHRVEMSARRVTAVCAVLGILSSTLQMYSLLWLYGLLGNWRHFSWSWWLCQFWGRILELFWGLSLIALVSWVSCSFTNGCSKSLHGYGNNTMSEKVLPYLRNGPLRKSEKTWEELMPNNWSKYTLSRAGRSNVLAMYDDQSDHTDPISTTSCDSQAAVLWQKVGERECVLSLIEFDMVPPSPINLRRSIDSALPHGPMMSGGLFIAPPPSWTQAVAGMNNSDGDDILPPAYSSFDWSMNTDSIRSAQYDLQTSEPPWFISDHDNGTTVSRAEHNSELLAVNQNEMSDDDITNL